MRKSSILPNVDLARVGRVGLMRALSREGFTEIGSGSFSSVYSKKACNYVIKLALDENQVSLPRGVGADGWWHFAKYALSHPSNLFPKIMKLERYGKRGYLAKMEKLDVTLADIWSTGDKRLSRTIELQYSLLQEVVGYNKSWARIYPGLKSKCGKEFSNEVKRFVVPLVSSVRHLKHGFTPDLHDSNVMLRKDGSLVVIDPYSYKML